MEAESLKMFWNWDGGPSTLWAKNSCGRRWIWLGFGTTPRKEQILILSFGFCILSLVNIHVTIVGGFIWKLSFMSKQLWFPYWIFGIWMVWGSVTGSMGREESPNPWTVVKNVIWRDLLTVFSSSKFKEHVTNNYKGVNLSLAPGTEVSRKWFT